MKSKQLARLDIITLFPGMFEGPMTQSLLGKARAAGVVDLQIHDLRAYSTDPKHHKVDDRPYGGGAGMVLQAEPIFRALQAIRRSGPKALRSVKPHVVFLSPQGRRLDQRVAQSLAKTPWVVLLCGHYEGVDERVMLWIDEEISIGDFVMMGGELPAMVVAETVVRLVPGVVKEGDSIRNDSFQDGLLDHPHYTRPAVWRKQKVPAVLLSGHHGDIEAWRAKQALAATKRKRPDLLGRRKSGG